MSQAVEFIQRNSGTRPLLIQSLYHLAEVYYYGCNLEKAKEKLQEAEKLCLLDPHANSQLYGLVLKNLGNIFMKQDALNDAETCYQKALSIFKDRNNIYMQGFLYSTLGTFIQKATETR
jgi:tetratricopeptide (TPR) repeat protein